MHQFDKVEMVRIVRPEDSMAALEEMTGHAEKVLQLLGLCRTVRSRCAPAIWASAPAKPMTSKYGFRRKNTYREISSCSNVWDFQARRMLSSLPQQVR